MDPEIAKPSLASRKWRSAPAVVLGWALLALTLGEGAASAGVESRNATATFTKYVTTWPEMAGIVGGDVGDGTYSGTVLNYVPGDVTSVIDAIYRFEGSRHSIVASVHVVQMGLHAAITGVVTDGWGAGNKVSGEYDQITCDLSGARTDCFQGTLTILRGTKH